MESRELAKTVGRELNSFGFSNKEFVETFRCEHRTIQQSFTRLCVAWLKYLSETEHYDGRNEASVMFAKSIKTQLDESCLPFV